MRVYPAKLVDGWVEKRFEPVVSEGIIKEYREVFARDRFSALGSVEERLKLLGTLLSFEHVVSGKPTRADMYGKRRPWR